MKVKCIKTHYWPDSHEEVDLDSFITIGKVYEVLPIDEFDEQTPWLLSIIDDNGNRHSIGKECFETLRDFNLNKLLGV